MVIAYWDFRFRIDLVSDIRPIGVKRASLIVAVNLFFSRTCGNQGKKTSLTVGYPDVLDLGRPAQKCPTLSNLCIEPVTICRHGPGLLEVAN